MNSKILISSPNNGGLSILYENKITYVDELNTTGLYFYHNKLFRCLQVEPLILIIYEENKILKLTYPEIKDVHDVACYNDTMYIVSTGTNEIFEISLIDYKIIKSHKYDGEGDAWHLNCLCIHNDSLYVSAFCNFKEHYSYKGQTKENGFLIDLNTSKIILSSLSQPHSPIIIDDSLLICNSEEKTLIIKNLKSNKIEKINFTNYTRGITFDEKYIYLGLSSSRNIPQDSKFSTIVILDKETFNIVDKIQLNHDEIYSICVLPENWNTSTLFQKISLSQFYNQDSLHIQLFLDQGDGISEETSIKLPVAQNTEIQEFVFDLSDRSMLTNLRLDPLNDSCVIEIEKCILTTDHGEIDLREHIASNALIQHDNIYFFDHNDPQIYFNDLYLDKLDAENLIARIRFVHIGNDTLKACINQIIIDKDYVIASKESVLEHTRIELDQTKRELDQTKRELDQTKRELDQTKRELDQTKRELDQTKRELDQTKTELTNICTSRCYKLTRPLRKIKQLFKGN